MNPTTVYSTKAEKYAKYRWDYAPQAIQTILDVALISDKASIADIGAGRGILTQHFVNKVKQVFAVEPNSAMRQMILKTLGQHPSCQVIDASAEATTLPDQSIDLITVAQAIHWFEPEPARTEFLRILKPRGWLALLRNYSTDDAVSEAMEAVLIAENGINESYEVKLPAKKPPDFYYGHHEFLRLNFPFTLQETWEGFIGSWGSAAPVPNEDHPLYPQFEQAAKKVFDRFSREGLLAVRGVTELFLGQVTNPALYSQLHVI